MTPAIVLYIAWALMGLIATVAYVWANVDDDRGSQRRDLRWGVWASLLWPLALLACGAYTLRWLARIWNSPAADADHEG